MLWLRHDTVRKDVAVGIRCRQRDVLRRILCRRHRLILSYWRAVWWGDSDGKGLRSTGVDATIRGTAIVLDLDRHRCRTVTIGRWRVGQRAVLCNCWLYREERIVVVGYDEAQRLA